MDTTTLFAPILDEIKLLRGDIDTLLDRVPESKPIKRYSPQELADATGLSVQTIWNALKDGRIKAKRLGKRYLISADEFERACKEVKNIRYQRSA